MVWLRCAQNPNQNHPPTGVRVPSTGTVATIDPANKNDRRTAEPAHPVPSVLASMGITANKGELALQIKERKAQAFHAQ